MTTREAIGIVDRQLYGRGPGYVDEAIENLYLREAAIRDHVEACPLKLIDSAICTGKGVDWAEMAAWIGKLQELTGAKP